LILNDRPLELAKTPEVLAVRYRQQRLYPCLHPAIDPQLPLRLQLVTPSGVECFALTEADQRFEPVDGSPGDPQWGREPDAAAQPWDGRIRPGDVTLDLRLG
jgi:hypothetical protein